MGEVWKAWDTDLRRWVALKFLKGDDSEELARFKREAQTAAKLSHPNIAAVYEARENYIAMQFIDGQTLETSPRDDARRLAAVVRDAALAVHHAHEQGVIHRDLKPANIMVEKNRVFVMDFGLARSMNVASSMSVSGTILGTPSYMSPEQARGSRALDHRTDVYSLGATLYELLVDRPPFKESNAYEILRKVVEEEPLPLRRFKARIDADLETIVMKCLEKEPSRRYATTLELADDLGRWLAGEAIRAHPPSALYRLSKFLARHKTVAGAVPVAQQKAAAARTRFEAANRIVEEAAAHHLIGRCLLIEGRDTEAIEAWNRAVAIDPAYTPALLDLAKSLLARYVQVRGLPAAIPTGGEWLFSAPPPESVEARALRVRADEETARLEKGNLTAEDRVLLEGLRRAGAGRYLEAAESLLDYVDREPWDVDAFDLLGISLFFSRNFPMAVKILEKAVLYLPTAERLIRLGRARVAVGDLDRAIEDFSKTMELKPREPAAVFAVRGGARGDLSRLKPDREKDLLVAAESDLVRALELGGPDWPTRPRVEESLGRMRTRLKELE